MMEQAQKGFDGLTFFVYHKIVEANIRNAERVSKDINEALMELPNWMTTEKELRELRKHVTFAVIAEEEDLDKVTEIVDGLFIVLGKAHKVG